MISIIILTLNEEQDLPSCLNALTWCDDIHLLDSGSTDDTLRIAKKYNLNCHYNKFSSFGDQRNYALDNIIVKYDWVLFLDADEVVTQPFVEEVLMSTKAATADVAGFYCCWKMMLDGRWLKYSDNFPKWQFRIVRKNRARFTDFGHGQKEGEICGILGYIKEPYFHFSYSKGWSDWIVKHNKYSTQEALDRFKKRPPFKNIFSTASSVRNVALKSWLSIIPGWPLLRFVHAYVLNFGFLEGRQGFIYSINMAYYEFLIQLKIKELQRKNLT